jgi:hypothetical protein
LVSGRTVTTSPRYDYALPTCFLEAVLFSVADCRAVKEYYCLNSPCVAQQQIAMTAPVIQKNESKGAGQQIAMTAPVLEKTEGDRQMMAFLLPKVISLSLFSPLLFTAAQHPPFRRPFLLLSLPCPRGVFAPKYKRAVAECKMLCRSSRWRMRPSR